MSVGHLELQRQHGAFHVGERVRSAARPDGGVGRITHLRDRDRPQECYTYALIEWRAGVGASWEWTGDLERAPEGPGATE